MQVFTGFNILQHWLTQIVRQCADKQKKYYVHTATNNNNSKNFEWYIEIFEFQKRLIFVPNIHQTYNKHTSNSRYPYSLIFALQTSSRMFYSFSLPYFFYFFSHLFKHQPMKTLRYNKINQLKNNNQEYIRVDVPPK